ncbi:MAG: HAD hydrolase-like protein [Anaerolineae bacterium]|nr:HAD hydrolase-like protein [Anaerolineae bacterium]
MLVIFDLDQTLVERYTANPLPGVAEALAQLAANSTPLMIATNQAGPAWRLWTGKERFPTTEKVCARFEAVAQALPELRTAIWLVAVYDARVDLTPGQFEDLAKAFNQNAPGLNLHAAANPTWRKPLPGMLWEACRLTGASVTEAWFVGDMDSDAQAAQLAGMTFHSASNAFCGQALSEIIGKSL